MVTIRRTIRLLEAIDVRDAASGETTRLASGGLFIFNGADAETAWLPPEIALDRRGYVLTGSDVQAAGRWALERDPYLLETSVPGIFACGDVRFGPVRVARMSWRFHKTTGVGCAAARVPDRAVMVPARDERRRQGSRPAGGFPSDDAPDGDMDLQIFCKSTQWALVAPQGTQRYCG